MHVVKLPAVAGLVWIRAGFRLMFQQFFGMLMMVMTYLFAFEVVSLLAQWVGDVAAAMNANRVMAERIIVTGVTVLSPLISIGFMEACRAAAGGKSITPLYFIKGFQLGKRAVLSLLGLGIFQVAAISVVTASLPTIPAESVAALTQAAAVDANSPVDAQLMLIGFAALCATSAVMLIVWYAPILAAWHGMRAAKAMFFSIAACWRNKSAFVMYGFGWLTVWLLVVSVIGSLIAAIGNNNASMALAAVTGLVMVGAMYCSVYVTYASVFVADGLEPQN